MTHFKRLFSFVLLLTLAGSLNAQISHDGTPASFENKSLSSEIDHLQIRHPDVQQLIEASKADGKNGRPVQIATHIDININMDNAGTWDILPDGRYVWRLKISSENAKALGISYDKFSLPAGSELFIYSPDKVQRIGAFNDRNNADGGWFATEMIYGSSLILEYISPKPRVPDAYKSREFINTANISIAKLEYYYQGVHDPYREKGFGNSQECEVNINCSEGASWQDEKRGVARILVKSGSGSFWCTGSLVNNSNENGTPYFLSAYHCADGISTAYYDQWIFYFNYEFSNCNNTSIEPSSNSITGCSHIAEGLMDGGSDFLLVELNSTPPAYYDVIYNGWTTTSSASSNGVGIHHPSGDVKKISTYTSPLSTSTYYGESTGASNAHWRVYWSSTANGHGVTEGGSSGSPIFNTNGKIVGTLSGGTSSCENTSGFDLYGKFSYHWDTNGGAAEDKLQPWLDPSNSLSEIDFYDPNNTGVTASSSANTQTITEGGSVNFSSTSTGPVESYSWTFEGGDPGSSGDPNPVVTYNTAGTYNVSLTVTGAGDSDTHTENGFITVNPSGSGDDCVYLNDPLQGTATLYTTDGGSSYVSGTNSYGDLSKANFFDHNGTEYVTALGFHAGYAEGSASNLQIAVWDAVGGSPGNLLASKSISMSNISGNFSEAGDYFEYNFNAPVEVDGDFFAGIILPGEGDIFALLTNTDGDVTTGTAWEEWDDGSWYPYSDASSWEITVDHAIYPYVCSSVSAEQNELSNIHLYPNPTTGQISIQSQQALTDVSITVYNSQGQIIQRLGQEHFTHITLDLSGYATGLYMIDIQSEQGHMRHKVQHLN